MKRACPHCGGENGYVFKDVAVLRKSGPWGSDEVDNCYEHETKPPKYAKCWDCGKRVLLKEAQGLIKPLESEARKEGGV